MPVIGVDISTTLKYVLNVINTQCRGGPQQAVIVSCEEPGSAAVLAFRIAVKSAILNTCATRPSHTRAQQTWETLVKNESWFHGELEMKTASFLI